ncbi:MAG: hypothetical protein EHM70_13370 [Chloroflexota bacterium]|nr:MAG: hypothetical protein EHM70_13370 [Chloroflexota bacterium]
MARLESEMSLLNSSNPQAEPDPPMGQASLTEFMSPPQYPVTLPSLRGLLVNLTPLPPYSIFVGSSHDGLPILVDLRNAEAGSILLLGEPGAGKSRLMQSILASGCLINPARKFRFCALSANLASPNSAVSQKLLETPHCYKGTSANSNSAYEIVVELANLVEERRYGRSLGPAILLAIDNLAEVVKSFDVEVLSLLAWLIKNGPAVQVWTLASLDARKLEDVPSALIDGFGTWLVGRISSLRHNPGLPDDMLMNAKGLIPGAQFSVYFEEEWVQFWIPELE